LTALRDLVPYAPPAEQATVVGEIIDLAPAMDPSSRSDLLADVAPVLAALPRPTAVDLLGRILHPRTTRTRQELLWELRAVGAVIEQIGGARAVADAVTAIESIGRWWP